MISSSSLAKCGSLAFLPIDNTPSRLLSPCSMGTQKTEATAESSDKKIIINSDASHSSMIK